MEKLPMQTEDGPRCIKKEYKNKTKFQTTTCQTISCVVMTQKKKIENQLQYQNEKNT